jgi:DNA polymerase III subunit delta
LFYIMYGQNNFSLHEELKKIKDGLGNPEMLEVNTKIWDGHEIKVNQLKDDCSTIPFLHQVRLVVVEGFLGRFEPPKKAEDYAGKGKLKSDSALKEWQTIYSYIETMPSTTILILIDGELGKKNPLLRHLSPLAEMKVFPKLEREAVKNWIRGRIAKADGKASSGAINLLEKLIGNNLWNINNEIDKLLAFCNGRLITEDDVRQITSYSR